MIDTELINSQIDIRHVAESVGAHFHGNSSVCPIHPGANNPTAFTIFNGGKNWKCWTHESECNRHGYDGIALLRALNGWSMKDVGERFSAPIDPQEAARRAVENAKRIEEELQEKIKKAEEAIKELRTARRWIEDHESMSQAARQEWERRGIPESWQSYFWLGYRESFGYNYDGQWYTSPSLTIPIFNTTETEPINIRHRILNPVDAKDKYRPERTGLEAVPFLGDRSLPTDGADRIIVVEGEIKAAVTFLTLDRPLVQVIGIPGKGIWSKIAPKLEGRRDTIILLDPDAKVEAVKMARSIGGAKVVDLPEKIDDMIVNYGLGRSWLESVFHNARMVV